MSSTINELAHPPREELPNVLRHAQIIKLAGGHVVARAVYALAELRIADYLKAGPQTAEELARLTGTHALSLYRLLRTTAGYGFFVEDGEHRFSLTPMGSALQSGAPGRARESVLYFAGQMVWRAQEEFLHSIRTGEPAMDKAHKQSLFEYLSASPDEACYFNQSMTAVHGREPQAIAKAYDFSATQMVVDVGGGVGNLLAALLSAYPHLSGVLYERPEVAGEAYRHIVAKDLLQRCKVIEGDFFEALPTGGDVYLLSHIIHNWDEEGCLKILANCHSAMCGKGRLLLIEQIIPEGNGQHSAKFADLVMLTLTRGGRERTRAEYGELLAKANFKLKRVIETDSPSSVIEAEAC